MLAFRLLVTVQGRPCSEIRAAPTLRGTKPREEEAASRRIEGQMECVREENRPRTEHPQRWKGSCKHPADVPHELKELLSVTETHAWHGRILLAVLLRHCVWRQVRSLRVSVLFSASLVRKLRVPLWWWPPPWSKSSKRLSAASFQRRDGRVPPRRRGGVRIPPERRRLRLYFLSGGKRKQAKNYFSPKAAEWRDESRPLRPFG